MMDNTSSGDWVILNNNSFDTNLLTLLREKNNLEATNSDDILVKMRIWELDGIIKILCSARKENNNVRSM